MPATSTSSYQEPWACELIVTPEQIHDKSAVTMTTVLSYHGIGILDPRENAPLYERFSFDYAIDGLPIGHSEGRDGLVNTLKLERLPSSIRDGGHEASVTVTPRQGSHLPITNRIRLLLKEIGEEGQAHAPPPLFDSTRIDVVGRPAHGPVEVQLQRSFSQPTLDQSLWAAIRNRTSAISFPRYQRFIDRLLGHNEGFTAGVQNAKRALLGQAGIENRPLNVFGPHAYNVLKLATQAFLTLECGVVIRDKDAFGYPDEDLFEAEHEGIRLDEEGVTAAELERRLQKYLGTSDGQPLALPYLKRIVKTFISLDNDEPQNGSGEVSPFSEGILKHRLTAPSMIELIWSYWLEEGMLVQTMNAIAWRFQNRRGAAQDPLVELEFDSLRPLNNLLWGYIQDEHNRLTVPRRAYEYQHHYGLCLQGKAVAGMTPADTRSKFVEAFHNLLYRTNLFYKEDRDTTVIADAFPLLNALKEVHLILAEGAHNQFGDLTWTARGEMLITQWMLARPEMREFLRGRYMVPYQEGWMGAVDSMKKLQGWTDTSITHFHELAMTGERILLSIRYGDWVDINNIEEQAKNWARNSKPEIQRYLHGYQAVTGVDLTAEATETQEGVGRLTQPSTLLQRRLRMQKTGSLGRPQATMRAIRAPTTPIKDTPAPRPVPQKYLSDK